MIYVYVYDNISKDDVETKNDLKTQAIYSSAQISTHAWDVKDGALYGAGKLHRKIRFLQFTYFDDLTKQTLSDFDFIHLKYGGLCFLDDGIKERFDFVKSNLDFIISQGYILDPLKNNLKLQDVQNRVNAYDKFILRRIFETKETSLIYYRPIPSELQGKKCQKIVDLLQNATNEEIKQCPLLRKVF